MKRWKPKKGGIYYSVRMEFILGNYIGRNYWGGYEDDIADYKSGNCFRTKKEAEQKLKLIKKILRDK